MERRLFLVDRGYPIFFWGGEGANSHNSYCGLVRGPRVLSLNKCMKVFFFSPTDAQVKCLENNIKIYVEININL